MLVLERRPDAGRNRILIGDDIVITIVNVRGNHVKVGIDAPNHVLILREEVADRKADDDGAST